MNLISVSTVSGYIGPESKTFHTFMTRNDYIKMKVCDVDL